MAKSPFSFFLEREKKSKSKFWSDGVLDLVDFQSTGSWDFSSLFDKRPLNVRCHVGNVFYLKDFVTWCSYQGRMRFFYCYCLFFDVKKQCLFQEQ
jgi:hypothetical protein